MFIMLCMVLPFTVFSCEIHLALYVTASQSFLQLLEYTTYYPRLPLNPFNWGSDIAWSSLNASTGNQYAIQCVGFKEEKQTLAYTLRRHCLEGYRMVQNKTRQKTNGKLKTEDLGETGMKTALESKW